MNRFATFPTSSITCPKLAMLANISKIVLHVLTIQYGDYSSTLTPVHFAVRACNQGGVGKKKFSVSDDSG